MITYFTPTYNRRHTLSRTFQSLCQQTSTDFEWLIVDDGSVDGTDEYVFSLIQNSSFPIRYYKQSNKGKYVAYNLGLKLAHGDFFMCVDSDDWLPINTTESVLSYADTLINDKTVAGLIALKENSDHQLIGRPFLSAGKKCGLFELENRGEKGERSLVFKTEIATRFPFPEEAGEMFMTESVIYDKYEGKYSFIVSNDILTTCEYQIDGLSKNLVRLMVKNPAGYKLYYAQRIDFNCALSKRIGYILRYHAFRYLFTGSLFDYSGKYDYLVSILKPCGRVLAWYYSRMAR